MKKLLITAALIAMAIIVNNVRVEAQGSIVVPPGSQVVCTFTCHGIIFIVLADGTIIETQANASGTGTLDCVSSNDGSNPNQPVGSAFLMSSVTVSGNDPTLGTYSFTFNPAQPLISTVTANIAGQEFPATGNIYANVTGTIRSIEGTFSNAAPCHMKATNLQSFNPHNNEIYTFVNDVLFTNDVNPDVQFTIPAGATITLN